MIAPIDYDSLDPKQRKTYREIAALRESNVAHIQKIESEGYGIDIWTARLEHFMLGLFAIGKITMDELLKLQKEWELELRKQTKLIAEAAEQLSAQQRQTAAAPKLWTPGG